MNLFWTVVINTKSDFLKVGIEKWSLEDFCKNQKEILFICSLNATHKYFALWDLFEIKYGILKGWKKFKKDLSHNLELDGQTYNIQDYFIANTIVIQNIPGTLFN